MKRTDSLDRLCQAIGPVRFSFPSPLQLGDRGGAGSAIGLENVQQRLDRRLDALEPGLTRLRHDMNSHKPAGRRGAKPGRDVEEAGRDRGNLRRGVFFEAAIGTPVSTNAHEPNVIIAASTWSPALAGVRPASSRKGTTPRSRAVAACDQSYFPRVVLARDKVRLLPGNCRESPCFHERFRIRSGRSSA